jgi:alkanesulfonate monooxygenase SsuD/methylene tetrahydromethanopterin reductase-like flavin-dependent oxidoreductase (luciferase family)
VHTLGILSIASGKEVHMKFGFVTSFGTVAQVLEMSREAEAAGWDGVFTWDGISIGPWEGNAAGATEAYDPWAMLGAMATVTERVTLGAMVFPLARRRPWKVARESITIDHLSNGRLVMPVGLGAADDGGFSRVNTDTPDRKIRAQRLDECLAILDLAWRGETFSFEGEHYQAQDLVFRPKPVQQPRIPIWVVGSWPHEKSLSRAARWDGILPSVSSAPMDSVPADTLREIRDWMRAHRESDAPFEIVLEGRTSGTDHAANREQLQPLAEAGATWWIESRWDETDTPESLLERIRQGPPRV